MTNYRRARNLPAILFAFAYLWHAGSVLAAEQGKRPNIFFYVADDFGVADASCYGGKWVQTPNIDRLATEGTKFNSVFAGSPSCNPSRSILYTGLMSARNGAHPNHGRVFDGTKSIAHYMRDAGYRVAVVNKFHVSPAESFPFEQVKAQRKQTEGGGGTIDIAVFDRWIESHLETNPEQPLCVFLCDNNTHLVWPDEHIAEFSQIEVPPCLPQHEATQQSLGRYYREVELLDERVGEAVSVLEKHKLLDDSLFVFTADQGPAWLHAKWTLYDLGLHVPFIARWPGNVPKGRNSDALISFADITPTLVELAGRKPPGNLDGVSMAACLSDPEQTHHQEIYGTHTGDGTMNNYPSRCIRTTRWKFIWNLRPDLTYTTHLTKAAGKDRKSLWDAWTQERETNQQIDEAMKAYQLRPEFELYDLQNDPLEMNNLMNSEAHSEVAIELKQKLEAWMVSQGDKRQDMTHFLSQKRNKRKSKQ